MTSLIEAALSGAGDTQTRTKSGKQNLTILNLHKFAQQDFVYEPTEVVTLFVPRPFLHGNFQKRKEIVILEHATKFNDTVR